MKKILTITQLNKILKKFKSKKIALAHGVFDYLHIGHMRYLKKAKSISDILVVSVTVDKFVNVK